MLCRLLWTTWFVTSVYVVRFGQDGILARMGFACHLGSLVGFTLLGISFGKEKLLPTMMKITCESARSREIFNRLMR